MDIAELNRRIAAINRRIESVRAALRATPLPPEQARSTLERLEAIRTGAIRREKDRFWRESTLEGLRTGLASLEQRLQTIRRREAVETPRATINRGTEAPVGSRETASQSSGTGARRTRTETLRWRFAESFAGRLAEHAVELETLGVPSRAREVARLARRSRDGLLTLEDVNQYLARLRRDYQDATDPQSAIIHRFEDYVDVLRRLNDASTTEESARLSADAVVLAGMTVLDLVGAGMELRAAHGTLGPAGDVPFDPSSAPESISRLPSRPSTNFPDVRATVDTPPQSHTSGLEPGLTWEDVAPEPSSPVPASSGRATAGRATPWRPESVEELVVDAQGRERVRSQVGSSPEDASLLEEILESPEPVASPDRHLFGLILRDRERLGQAASATPNPPSRSGGQASPARLAEMAEREAEGWERLLAERSTPQANRGAPAGGQSASEHRLAGRPGSPVAEPRGLEQPPRAVPPGDSALERQIDLAFDTEAPFDVGRLRTGERMLAPGSPRPVPPLDSLNLSAAQERAANRLLGKRLNSRLRQLWRNVNNPLAIRNMEEVRRNWRKGTAEARKEARTLARKTFDSYRRRFWNAVSRDPRLRLMFEEAGFVFPESPPGQRRSGSPPFYRFPGGYVEPVTIEHLNRVVERPFDAVNPNNLMLVMRRENVNTLELVRRSMDNQVQ